MVISTFISLSVSLGENCSKSAKILYCSLIIPSNFLSKSELGKDKFGEDLYRH